MTECNYPALGEDISLDCAVVGGGLSGIFTAYLLAEKGLSVGLFESGKIASGKSGRSTAKVSVAHPGVYSEIADRVSEDAAIKYAAANLAGMRLFSSLTDKLYSPHYGMRDMYVYSKYGTERLRKEYAMMSECCIECAAVHDTPLPFAVKSAVLVPAQRQIDPVDFAERLCRAGKFRVFENSPVILAGHRTISSCGHRITADKIMITTNYPLSIPIFASPIRLSRKTSCAVRLKNVDEFPDVMAYGEDVEIGFRRDGDSLIVSGCRARGAGHLYTAEHLLDEAREFSPDCEIVEKWTNNDTYTHDKIPYAGEVYPGVYTACGYSAWGMTNSAACAIILAEAAVGGKLWYADVFSPGNMRRSGKMLMTSDFSEHMAVSVKGNVKRMLGTVKNGADEVEKNEGMIIMHRGQKVGVYRDNDGVRHYVNVKCPHLGCELEWNAIDLTWDCPCHGSRFSYTGECISNPAVKKITAEF